jgi:hypothetical protein
MVDTTMRGRRLIRNTRHNTVCRFKILQTCTASHSQHLMKNCTLTCLALGLLGRSVLGTSLEEYRLSKTESYDDEHVFGQKQGDWGGVLLLCSIKGDMLHSIAVATEASGWLGFDISDAGAIPGADIVVFEAATKELKDYNKTLRSIPLANGRLGPSQPSLVSSLPRERAL